ncbi:alpha-ketoglutarate-dependent dioxygenase AlkB family protein [Halomonas salifodinae]|uniref:alpha-ketoglutarate-dependent dioxygenase AlkB family protein n=1 Tax=Halomonas salifodinae TaxID=438745 RepID=UPI0033A328ED
MPSPYHWKPLLDDPSLWRLDGALGEPAASRLLQCLDAEIAWERPSLRLYGREHPIPRQQAWMGEPEAGYRYSGRDFVPQPWHPALPAIRHRIEARLAALGQVGTFNSVLLNRYADGRERMGWHSDDEPELGETPLIAALTLGAERPLRFRWKDRRAPAFNVWLPHDSLLVMGPGCQERLQHALLPRALPGLRISLTFRRIDSRSR